MKLTNTLTAAFTALTFIIIGCEEKKAVPHDHDGDGIPDHGPGAHDDHSGHDHGDKKHAEDDHKGHDHDANHDDHDHAKKIAGPNGGRVIITIEPHAEFFVTADRKVRITFLGEDNKAIPVAAQSVSIVCGDRSNPTMLTLAKEADGNSLLSSSALPAGNNFPTIVTLKTTPDADAIYAKFTLNLSDCPSCKHKEYACTCDHGH